MDLFDAFQKGMITSASHKAEFAKREAKHTADRLHFEMQQINSKIDGLALLCEALWEILQEYTNLSDEDIHRKVDEIDLRDGRRDGKMGGTPATCSDCGRPGHTRQVVCMYCGGRF